MNHKVELVLNGLIKLYIKKSIPLSSTKLKEYANLPYSASSIRSYLKSLEEKELICKEHISSGSYPSVKAMKQFWLRHLKNTQIDVDTDFKEMSEEFDVFIMIEMFENQVLMEVYNLNNKFIVLEFEKDELVIKYDDNLFILFSSLKGIYLDELKKYLLHLNLNKLVEKIKSLYKKVSFNKKFLYQNVKNTLLFENYKFEEIPNGISFMENLLVYKQQVKNSTTFLNIALVGDIYTDFFRFMKGGASE
jgi:heat-inducible transcriptional repressor